jgi:leader peptidase (prepilin peptidase)/N-methyltransferase
MSSNPAWLMLTVGVAAAGLAVSVLALTARHLARASRTRCVLGHRAVRLAGGLVAGVLATGAVWRVGAFLEALVVGWLVVITPALVGLDMLERRLPDALTLGSSPIVAALVALDALAGGSSRPVLGAAIGLVLVGGFYLIVAVAAPRGGLGPGDVKLAGLIGMVTGSYRLSEAIVATIMGLVIAAIVGAVAIAHSRNTRIQIAMGPAILSGALVAAFV